MWPERPPRTAVHLIQIYVSELRRTFEPHAGAPLIATRPPGYLLEVAPDCVDAERFAQLVADGVRGLHDGNHAGGVDLALSGGFIDDIQPQLEQLRSEIVAGEIDVPTSPSAPAEPSGSS